MDLGLSNLATCVNSTNGPTFIINGKSLKSINHQYNGPRIVKNGHDPNTWRDHDKPVFLVNP